MTKAELREMIHECLQEELSLVESSLTAEQKVDAWNAGTRRENYKAAGIPKLNTFLDIAKRKGYTEIVDILEGELARRGVKPETTETTMTWEELIEAADKLLDELAIESDNPYSDDGDGYWQVEHVVWCNRKLYYTRLNNITELEKLCAEYSKKLPNVEFYFTDDQDEEVSEIGYAATKVED